MGDEVNVIVAKIDKATGKTEGKYFSLNGGNLTRDEFLEKLVEKSGYPIPLEELKTAFPWVMLDIDHCSYGQVIELECGYNIQFTEIDFDGLDFSFYGEGDDDFDSNDDEAEE